MLKMLSNYYWSICLYALGVLLTAGKVSVAQVTPDNTVGTQVDTDGNVSEITGGETRGENLFHSFQDFSVPTNNEAFFNNSTDISNIFSRVTGGNVSNIDGAIRANGSASLFLINPAGIMFGENASLNLGGSFYGSTADSILFEDGEFSAANPDAEPLLTINAPIGFNFRDNPAEIVNRSFAQNSAEELVGLEVDPGNNLALIGGDINFEAGQVTARNGNIELGGVSAAGEVGINEDGSLNFSENVAKANLTLTNNAIVAARGNNGSIQINARNVEITAGEFGSSFLIAGIAADTTSTDARSGDVTIDATGNITIDDSVVGNRVDPEATGSAGNIVVSTGNLSLANGGVVDATTFGQGNAGSVEITANGSITIHGEDSNGFSSRASSRVGSDAVGDAEGVTITTGSLSLTNGGRVDVTTFGQGNAGSIEITANDSITIDGAGLDSGFQGVLSQVGIDAVGDAGGITIATGSLSLTNGATIDASTFSQGNAGSIEITANDSITIDGAGLDSGFQGVLSQVGIDAVGNAGGINITTGSLSLFGRGLISTSMAGEGNAGEINIIARDNIVIDAISGSGGLTSGINSLVGLDAVGNAGNVTIETGSLSLLNGVQVDTSTAGEGNAGEVNITARDSITIDGEDSNSFNSSVSSQVGSDAVGDAGGVTITTGSLSLTNGGRVDATTFGQGNAGSVEITASDSITVDSENSNGSSSGALSRVNSNAVGDAGGVTITTGSLSLTNGGRVDATTFGQGNAGSVEITASDSITIDGEGSEGFPSGITSIVNTDAVGNSGGVVVNTDLLSLTDEGRIAANAVGQGNAGRVNIRAESVRLDGDNARIRALTRSGTGGIINLEVAENITLNNNSSISAQAFEEANGGRLIINAEFIIAFPNGNNDIIASAEQGQGGTIDITAEALLGIEERPLSPTTNDINASSEFGIDGSVSIRVLDIDSFEGVTELDTTVVEPGETVAQICDANRELTAQSGLIVTGRGGSLPTPDLPLDSTDVILDSGSNSSGLPQPLKTSKGRIQPAMGVRVTETGVTLTAYKTDNKGTRLPQSNSSCGVKEG